MSISHWGLFPGWWGPEYTPNGYGLNIRVIWKPKTFEEFCAAMDGRR